MKISNVLADPRWIAVAALVIGFVIRMLKDDTKGPTLSPRLRFWLVFALGAVAGVLEKFIAGASWEQAIIDGLGAALLAHLGHQAIVESARGGKELPVPGLMKDPKDLPPPSGPSILGIVALVGFLSLTQNACTAQQREAFLKDTFADKLRCGIDNINLPDQEILKRCLVNSDDIERFLDLIGKQRVAMAGAAAAASQFEQERYKAQLARERAGACGPGAGAR